ncbi:unnamed protein product, partial [Menidia menidia]
VEIHPVTGVVIEKLAWAYAINANSATVFVRHLLTAVFPTETLLKSKALTRKDPAKEFLAMYSHSPLSVTDCDQSPKKTVVELKREIQDLKEENAKLRELLVEDVPELMKTMKNVIDLAEPLKRSSFELPQSSTQSRPGSSSDDSQMPIPKSVPSVSSESVTPSTIESQSSKVEIHPGTGVMIAKLAWAYAINANSATVFVRHLLTAVFPTETLLIIKLYFNPSAPYFFTCLGATLERWPGTKPSSIGVAINGKITELRAK